MLKHLSHPPHLRSHQLICHRATEGNINKDGERAEERERESESDVVEGDVGGGVQVTRWYSEKNAQW